MPILEHKQMSFGKPILTHAYLPNTLKARNLLLCLVVTLTFSPACMQNPIKFSYPILLFSATRETP